MAAEDLEWERSKISNQDLNMLKRLGLMKKEDAIRFPSEESYPNPPMEYRNHPTMDSLPPLPEDGEVEEQAIVAEDNQGSSLPESEVAGSHKSAASHEKEVESKESDAIPSSCCFPKNKRKRNDAEDSGTSKPEEAIPSRQKASYDPYLETLIEKLAEANKRADALVQKLEQSEAARKKAELVASEAKAKADEARAKVASVEELQKRLEDAESALNEHKTAQAAREQGILKRLKLQIRRTETQTNQGFDLENPVNDPLLDTLSYLELHGSEIREGVANASAGLSTMFPYFFPKKEEPLDFPCPCQELQFIRRPWTEDASGKHEDCCRKHCCPGC
ncbi:hypothetical protein QYE76_016553 [Lolium multiflorum]|uniref:Uncharacterized protein n=1 Tax=Lolium multiflorum TaxID=4521 RepID=A0AAD8VFI5_LOLMU|nr:hypothetical protein QYE76_016553 [Lolium multiflorum]